MLSQIPGVPITKASAITSAFPKLRSLYSKLEKSSSSEGELLLTGLDIPNSKIGAKIMKTGESFARKVRSAILSDD